MRKLLFILGLSLAGCFPKPPKDAPITRFVYDDGDLFSPAEEDMLDSVLRAYEQRTTNEFVVYTEADSTIADSTFQQMVEQLSDTLGVGKRGKNNGLITAFNKGGRLLFTVSQYNVVPDTSITDDIHDSVMIPPLSEERYLDAFLAGTRAFMDVADSTAARKARKRKAKREN